MWIYKGQIQTFRRAENNLIIIQYARCNKERDWLNFKMECWDTEISQFEDVWKTIGDFKKANALNEIHLFENKEDPLHYGIAMAPRTHGMATYFFNGAVDLNTHYLPYFLAEIGINKTDGY